MAITSVSGLALFQHVSDVLSMANLFSVLYVTYKRNVHSQTRSISWFQISALAHLFCNVFCYEIGMDLIQMSPLACHLFKTHITLSAYGWDLRCRDGPLLS